MIKFIVTITITITLLRPTTAGIGDFLGSIVNTCQYSTCESFPRCPIGYDSLSQTREGKIVCKNTLGSVDFVDKSRVSIFEKGARDSRKKSTAVHLARALNATTRVATKKCHAMEIIVNWIVAEPDALGLM